MIAVFIELQTVKSDKKHHAFAGSFETFKEGLSYLKFLEDRGETFYVQVGWTGWGR